ncbi:MAG: trypsin-like peptidase domain-containing protein, partial [Anaerolineae bacterium]|nr:trypsin-like peptidase domain-containing protein [Anaerolineae bacterium]
MYRKQIFLVIIVIALVTMSCSFSSTPTPAAPPTDAPVEAPAATATTAPEPEKPASGAITGVENVKQATVQIEAQGTFVDPQVGTLYNAAGRGTGFIIDSEGIAVTNNHVVTGAALIKVWVGGESEPRNAKILGVSECWDLAVIDIEGDGYPYLDFHDGSVDPGLEVYAAGFPLGDPEYTLTKGIVSKAKADGESYWASVPSVIEHDARIRGGNSGGPLVDENGAVVGINYAGNDQFDQNYAIKAQDALKVIDTLKEGDFESIGINGQAVTSEDGSLSGIWVSSVKSGSPADKTGLEGGDIITQLEGLILSTDGTMKDYCDILRTRDAEATMSVEVLRFNTSEYLAGQLNGDKLETSFSFANELEADVAQSGENYTGYVTVQDDSGSIQMNVPAEWAEIDGSNWVMDGEVIGAAITAAPSVDAFNNTYEEPGVFFGASDDVAKLAGYVQLLDAYRDAFKGDCTFTGRYDYVDSAYEGAYDVFEGCAGANNTMVVLSARPQQYQTSMLVTVIVNLMSENDAAALDEILRTFDV